MDLATRSEYDGRTADESLQHSFVDHADIDAKPPAVRVIPADDIEPAGLAREAMAQRSCVNTMHYPAPLRASADSATGAPGSATAARLSSIPVATS